MEPAKLNASTPSPSEEERQQPRRTSMEQAKDIEDEYEKIINGGK
jgi:hypothetical protein